MHTAVTIFQVKGFSVAALKHLAETITEKKRYKGTVNISQKKEAQYCKNVNDYFIGFLQWCVCLEFKEQSAHYKYHQWAVCFSEFICMIFLKMTCFEILC